MADAFLGAYRGILRTRHAWRFSVAGWFARLVRSTAGIGTILLIGGRTGEYAVAGAAAGAVVLGAAVAGPLWSRVADRRGQSLVLAIALGSLTASSALLIAAVDLRWPVPVAVAAAFLVGATAVDAGALSRARWLHLLDESHARHTALALESVLDEFTFVIGPPVVTLVAAAASPELGFATGVAVSLAGYIAVLAQRSTAPRPSTESARGAGGWLPHGVLGLLPGYVGVGLIFGSVDVTAVGVASAIGETWYAGAMLAVFAVGSVVAGVVFGALAGRWAPLRRLALAGILFALVMPWFALVGSPWWFGVVSLLAGLATTPMLISSSSVIETVAQRGAITVAMSWPTVAMSVGVTVASSVTGAAVDAGAAYGGLWIPACAAVLVLVTSVLNARLRRRPPSALHPGRMAVEEPRRR